MNAPAPSRVAPTLHGLALAALELVPPRPDSDSEAHWLWAQREACGPGPQAAFHAWLDAPPEPDQLLHALARALRLQPLELLAVALACAVETDAMTGRVIAWLQNPVGTSRPSVGLVLAVAQALGLDGAMAALLEGRARDNSLLMLESDLDTSRRPLPEQTLHVPLPLVLALHAGASRWPGVQLVEPGQHSAVDSLRAAAARHAHALRPGGALVIRSGHPGEARSAAALVAEALGMRAALFEQEPAKGAGLWLAITGAVPVLYLELAPGETRKLPNLAGYHGPLLVACGPDGSVAQDEGTVASWQVPLPHAAERTALWASHTGDAALARRLGEQHRYDATRIHLLARSARHAASLEGTEAVAARHVSLAARRGLAADLGTLAELLSEDIDDGALIIPAALRVALLALRQRCELRESLADHLGPSARTRYKPGVRALFVGPSGTGKTLAAGWLATRLGLPLYRVDIAAVTSKYIGETEKNLSQLFARAEHAEVVLLFDEADSLFGKRTEVKESNDRFANTQTNYLLQRIESFEGIALLTSNSRSRFDSAFTRRLDAILEFPQPSPEERRALWVGHLGEAHTLSSADLNRLAAACDLAGGHIRNAVLAAATNAVRQCRNIDYGDVVEGIDAECRKLGKQPPSSLAYTPGSR